MPLDFGLMINENEPVRLLDAVLEELDYTELLHLYSSKGRKSAVNPVLFFKVFVFGMLEGIYSLRGLQRQCDVNIQYKWLLQSFKVPSHMAFGRFFKRLTAPVLNRLFAQFIKVLSRYDSITFEEAFIDGTKIEANANRYTFVWKKNVIKSLGRLKEKLSAVCQKLLALTGVDASALSDTALLDYLTKECRDNDIEFVHGTGKHKHQLQKIYEECEAVVEKRLENEAHLEIMGERNSYSKTDNAATFMRMKEDHMGNGQLKPAYNVQFAVQSEYILGVGIFANPTDTRTLIPFLQQLETLHGKKIEHVVADAGYDSEENLAWLDRNGYLSVIKPKTYEVNKKRSYAEQIGRAENMEYDEAKNEYICAKGRRLRYVGTTTQKNSSGYMRESKVYQCSNCNYCSKRSECQRSFAENGPTQNKRIFIADNYLRLQEKNMRIFSSTKGILLRINRSIQVEGSFGVMKEDFKYKRMLRRGKENVYKELLMLAFGFNLRKLHNRIQSGRIGTRLFAVKEAC